MLLTNSDPWARFSLCPPFFFPLVRKSPQRGLSLQSIWYSLGTPCSAMLDESPGMLQPSARRGGCGVIFHISKAQGHPSHQHDYLILSCIRKITLITTPQSEFIKIGAGCDQCPGVTQATSHWGLTVASDSSLTGQTLIISSPW